MQRRNLDFLHHFFADAGNRHQFFGVMSASFFDAADAVDLRFFRWSWDPFRQFRQRRAGRGQRRHLRLDLLALLFLALDIDIPADQLAGQRTFWPFLPMARESCVSSTILRGDAFQDRQFCTRVTFAGLSDF